MISTKILFKFTKLADEARKRHLLHPGNLQWRLYQESMASHPEEPMCSWAPLVNRTNWIQGRSADLARIEVERQHFPRTSNTTHNPASLHGTAEFQFLLLPDKDSNPDCNRPGKAQRIFRRSMRNVRQVDISGHFERHRSKLSSKTIYYFAISSMFYLFSKLLQLKRLRDNFRLDVSKLFPSVYGEA